MLIRNRSFVSTLMILSLLFSQQVLACTGIIVGKAASATGSYMIARNEDFPENNWAKHMVVRVAAEHEEGDLWQFGSGLSVAKPSKTLQYTAMPDWDANTLGSGAGPFEEVGINSLNVAVTATYSAEANEKSQKADPFVKPGIDESVIPTLLLSQATSARHAVELLGGYVESIGAAEANGLAISDQKEAWLMEIGSGHHWIAVKVPDNQYVVQANALRIYDIDITNKKRVLHSKGLLEHVKKHQLLGEVNSKRFDFARAFGVLNDDYNTDRIWLAQHLLSPSIYQEIRQERYPLFMKPDKKLTVLDIANMLRADYTGTPLEGKAERVIGIDRNVESHIIEMRPGMPPELAGVIWQSIGNVSDSIFIPLYGSITDTPRAYRLGTNEFDSVSAYWRFRSVGALLNSSDGQYREALHELRDQAEQRLVASLPYVDNAIKKMLAKDREMALWYINMHSNGFALQALERVSEIRSKLMTDITKSTEKEYDPEEWKKISEL
ncbi:C69 family dipeptidase [Aestuariirhabdus sp. Z084]|uniref:C69 family dipeptidase n=1 Tax=Aestuariirhabdus haliotis TaxID=2918751 RepID=UPI00201B4277|nr:C69 family dipeptidase [Aestuariirhabdus haliotis]MCL6417665.1 C69 family dipeptidase [Aestuariirhabdus haliotis]MCL6421608.1 C69 family dipeptidase [Aestuariirhabdus haliotis]